MWYIIVVCVECVYVLMCDNYKNNNDRPDQSSRINEHYIAKLNNCCMERLLITIISELII